MSGREVKRWDWRKVETTKIFFRKRVEEECEGC